MRAKVAVAAGVLALLLTGSAQASPIVVEAQNLSRGANPTVAVGHGYEIRTGKREIIPLPPSDHGMVLLGATPRGWVVHHDDFVEAGHLSRLYLVQNDGDATMFYERFHPYEEYYISYSHSYRLSDDRTRVFEVIQQDEALWFAVVDLDGNVVAPLRGSNGTRVLDFSGPRAILSTAFDLGPTYSWRIGYRRKLISDHASNFADLDHDLLFRRVGFETFGLAKISAPGTIRWKAAYRPTDLSPDGTKLVGTAITPAGPKAIIQIRRIRDGKVLRAFKVDRANAPGLPAWENNTSILLRDRNGTELVLVRCRISGYCNRATPWFSRPDALLSIAPF